VNVVYTREKVAQVLRIHHPELADEALRSLPERVDAEELWRFANKHGISLDLLMNEMGGSP